MVWPLDSIGEWEPNFQWDDASPFTTVLPGDTAMGGGPVWDLYDCLLDALGPLVDLDRDSGRQGSGKRRKGKAETQEKTNNNIRFQAAKMTKCIVNYMAAGSDQHIIDYDFEYDLEIENVIVGEDVTHMSGEESVVLDTGGGYVEGYRTYIHLDEDDYTDIDIDIDWEIYEVINYMAAPMSTISIANPVSGD